MKKIIIVYFVLLLVVILLVLLRGNKLSLPFNPFAPSTTNITISNKTFRVTLAKSPEELQTGLSKTNKLDADQGMLFVFSNSSRHPFWMKDMKFPIDIIFIKDGTIVDIFENVQPPSTTDQVAGLQIYRPKEDANFVLEVPAGTVNKNNIKIGDKIDLKNVK